MAIRHFLVSGLSGLVLLAPFAGQTAPPPGRLLASQCAQCHGTDGRAVGDMDRLAGENFNELWEEMLEMKYSGDTGDIMHRQAKGYTEEQIRLIAQYYAGSNSRDDSIAGGGDRSDYDERGGYKEDEHEEHDD